MNETLFLHCLLRVPGIGSEKIRKLLAHFGTSEAAWTGTREALLTSGLSEKLAEKIVGERNRISPERELELLDRHRIRLVGLYDADYPALLTEIPNPPILLYTRGNAVLGDRPLITIVGTRKPSEYGVGIAREFAKELARSGLTVVSGMALGIDKEAHRGALEGNGETIAVLGNGLDDDSIAPRTHLELAHAIEHRGLLVSDYPPGTPASDFTFPARNRIMAGLSLGTIVIEASEKSGTLITARLATEYNREVFAVPGSIYTEGSRGPHALLREGATLAAHLSDILDALPLVRDTKRLHQRASVPETSSPALSSDEEKLLKILGSDTMHVDILVKRSELKTANALSAISFLEMKGLIKNIGSMKYIRVFRV